MAKQLRWTLTPEELRPYELCAVAKGKQINIPKLSDGFSAKDGGNRVYLLDIATVKHLKEQPKAQTPNWWWIMVDKQEKSAQVLKLLFNQEQHGGTNMCAVPEMVTEWQASEIPVHGQCWRE